MSDNFPLSKDAYLSFDGLSIKEKIKERLTQTGIFTDQNFEGSNLAALNDVISMVFSLLLFNLNKTSINGQFSETTIYENINRIVKELNYNPTGYQTSTLNYTMSARNIDVGFYAVPRYSSISVGGIDYSFNADISFNKLTTDETEEVLGSTSSQLLYQGVFNEFPTIKSSGVPNEIVYLTVDDSLIVDHFNIFVYIKEPNTAWKQWNRTSSLYLQRSTDERYEVRFNENKRYEIKFGNGINGKAVPINSEIAIYYLVSSGENGEVGTNVLQSARVTSLGAQRLASILADEQYNVNYITDNDIGNLIFDNKSPSTYYSTHESVEEIKKNAPLAFRSQFTLTTQASYEAFLNTNFSNILHDVKVMNNSEYLDSYIKYFYNLGLTNPQLEQRALFNQVRFADACNFNNVYCFVVPKTRNNVLSFISPEQKTLILRTIREEKVLTSETLIIDPVYLAVDFALAAIGETKVEDTANTRIVIKREPNTRRADSAIQTDVYNIIVNLFARINNKLGQTINLNQLTVDLLAVDGVQNIFTQTTSTQSMVEGLNMIVWNPRYPQTVTDISTNITLESFQFPYLATTDLISKINFI
jgi:DNA-dependent RNA polymerase auxiliary subunit epsilon